MRNVVYDILILASIVSCEQSDYLNSRSIEQKDLRPNIDNSQNNNSSKGVQLYVTHCEACHNKLEISTKKGASPSRIQQGLCNGRKKY